jgi:heme/copper-type cytochrome/quinol oxidase subunit 2
MRNPILKALPAALAGAVLCSGVLLAEQPDEARARARTASMRAAEPPNVRKYQITASEGDIMPGHIRLRLGEKVRITFVSRDDTYGIRFKDFGIKEKLTPERPIVIMLEPRKAGTFEFRCTRNWGIKRFSNNGAIVVTE